MAEILDRFQRCGVAVSICLGVLVVAPTSPVKAATQVQSLVSQPALRATRHVSTHASASADPSGVPIPGAVAGWRQTFADDFTGTALNPKSWSTYTGTDKNAPSIATWSSSNVSVSGGVAHLVTRWDGATGTAAGMSSAIGGGQSYGEWLARIRYPKGDGVNEVDALYPVGGGWPPEIDFAESGGGTRDHVLATLHYSPKNTQIHRTLSGIDFSQWHTLGVITSPGHIQFLVDGRVWADYDSSGVPADQMWMVLQSSFTPCSASAPSCADDATPATTDTQVDWVVRYAKS